MSASTTRRRSPKGIGIGADTRFTGKINKVTLEVQVNGADLDIVARNKRKRTEGIGHRSTRRRRLPPVNASKPRKRRPSPASRAALARGAGPSAAIVRSRFSAFLCLPDREVTTDEPQRSSAARPAPGATRREADSWRGSQHKLAMQHATDQTVLGDFNDASFDYYGVHSRFFRKDGKFLVETDGPDGKLADVRGQVHLRRRSAAAIPGRVSRRPPAGAVDRLGHAARKTRAASAGSISIPNEEIRHDDVLHWTKLNQNWNFMCAECHSTGVRKNYDAAKRPLRHHLGGDQRRLRGLSRTGLAPRRLGARAARLVAVRQARRSEQGTARPLRRAARRRLVDRSGDRQRHRAAARRATLRKEVETCGLCHARRGQFSEDWVPGRSLSDTHVVSPLEPRALSRRRADARRGLQLRLVQAEQDVRGRRHLQRLPRAAQRQAARCPATASACNAMPPTSTRRAAPSPHEGADPAPTCASCHMPARTYMVVDRRHDHSFRIPRPDLSAAARHAERLQRLPRRQVGRNGRRRRSSAGTVRTARASRHYAEAFHAAWNGQRGRGARCSA